LSRRTHAGALADASEPTAERSRVYHSLDALRGIAATAVVIFHFRSFFGPITMPGGYLAVDLFFLMSGIVLARAYEARLRAGMTTGAFMRLRLIRLYPLYLCGAVLSVLMAAAGFFRHNTSHWDVKSLLISVGFALVFLPDPLPNPINSIFPLNPPSWSLFFELFVNLLYAALAPLLSSRRLVFICVISGIGVALTIAIRGSIDVGHNLHNFVYGFPRTIFGFSLGVLIARGIPDGPVRDGGAWRAVLIFGAVIIALAAWPTGDLRAMWDGVCLFALFPIIVYLAVRANPPRAWRSAATFLGLTSYALYALHAPLIGPITSLFRGSSGETVARFGAITCSLILGILLLMSWLADRYFDTPVRRFLGRAAR
jgi:peptidoglycan/LPS O-acetylase OafA/YrhL